MAVSYLSKHELQVILMIGFSLIGVLSEIVLVADGCAHQQKAITLQATYMGSVGIIAWRRVDLAGEITLQMTGQTSCEPLPTVEYNLTKYTFRCNSTNHEYSMKINQVEEDDINTNWTITVSSSNGREESDPLQIESCVTDELQVANPNGQNGLSDGGKIGLGIAVGVCALAVMLIVYRKRKSNLRRIRRNISKKQNEFQQTPVTYLDFDDNDETRSSGIQKRVKDKRKRKKDKLEETVRTHSLFEPEETLSKTFKI